MNVDLQIPVWQAISRKMGVVPSGAGLNFSWDEVLRYLPDLLSPRWRLPGISDEGSVSFPYGRGV